MKKITFAFLFAAVVLISYSFFQNTASSSPPEIQKTKAAAPSPTFLFLSDIHLNILDTTITYGEDTGLQLWKNFLAKTDSVLAAPNAPGFIVYTGDLPAHYSCESGCYLPPSERATHNANIKAILSGLRALAVKYKKPLFYLPGNNDGLAGDYYSFADETQQTPFSLLPENKNRFPALNINAGTKAPCMVSNPHPTMGYYSAMPVKGLRLIAMNTVMFSPNFVSADSTFPLNDYTTEMAWLGQQLQDAKAKNEKVYIAMHIPPGVDAYSGGSMWITTPMQNGTLLNSFLSFTSQYQQTIAGILYGHTHMDEVRRLHDLSGTKITEVAISCPGVTPQHYNNPGFKIVTYAAASKELLDFKTLYTTPQATYWGNASYTFSGTYGSGVPASIFETLSALPLETVSTDMGRIFTVMNGPAQNITRGIEVKVGN